MSFDDSRPLMRVERLNLMLVLGKFCIDSVACGDLEVFEGVHVINVNASIKVSVGKLTEVNLADCVFDIRPIESITSLSSCKHSCDAVNASHFFFYIYYKNNYKTY